MKGKQPRTPRTTGSDREIIVTSKRRTDFDEQAWRDAILLIAAQLAAREAVEKGTGSPKRSTT